MSKRKTAATLFLVAVILTATAAVNSAARNARDFGRGYREGYRAASAPLATVARPVTPPEGAGRPFKAGFERGRVEAARAIPAAHRAPAPPNDSVHATSAAVE